MIQYDKITQSENKNVTIYALADVLNIIYVINNTSTGVRIYDIYIKRE